MRDHERLSENTRRVRLRRGHPQAHIISARRPRCAAVTRGVENVADQWVYVCNRIAPRKLTFVTGTVVAVCAAHFAVFEAGLDVDVAVL